MDVGRVTKIYWCGLIARQYNENSKFILNRTIFIILLLNTKKNLGICRYLISDMLIL